jgi:hypothetical protein
MGFDAVGQIVPADMHLKPAVTFNARDFRNLHLITIDPAVTHHIFFGMTVEALEPPLCMDIPRKMMMFNAVQHGVRSACRHGGPIGAAVIMFEKSLIVGTHVVLVVTVQTLFIRDISGESVLHGVARSGSIYRMILAPV